MTMSKGRMEPLLQNSAKEKFSCCSKSRETETHLSSITNIWLQPYLKSHLELLFPAGRTGPLRSTQDGVTRLSCADLQWEEEYLPWKIPDTFEFIATFLLRPW